MKAFSNSRPAARSARGLCLSVGEQPGEHVMDNLRSIDGSIPLVIRLRASAPHSVAQRAALTMANWSGGE